MVADGSEAIGPGAVITRSLEYLEKRQAQLQYAAFAAQGYPRGSGSVESANKLVVEARLKGAGMRWARPHVNPVVALRTVACSDRWAEAWPQITAQWRAHVWMRRRHRATARRQAAGGGSGHGCGIPCRVRACTASHPVPLRACASGSVYGSPGPAPSSGRSSLASFSHRTDPLCLTPPETRRAPSHSRVTGRYRGMDQWIRAPALSLCRREDHYPPARPWAQ